ncbi:hypothetical protein [Micromonospora sp. CPCC 205556]|uniref:hypothetical protein n=1 Tax=Micromonospora sp. CPCC 205556 TaxID=3122398 RepID=UPI002FEEBDC9
MPCPRRTRSSVFVGALTVTLAATLTPAAAPAAPRTAPTARPATAAPADAWSGAPAAGAERWSVDLAVAGGDDVNVRVTAGRLRLADSRPGARTRPAAAGGPVAEGTLLGTPRVLARPATRVSAAVTADLAGGGAAQVQVRSWRTAGWTEWREAATAAVFDRPVTRVQARVLLTARNPRATAAVRAVALTADTAAVAAAATPGRVYRVYATRIGLVGGVTANGRTVQPRDHFAALPSRRSLSPINTGDYTVRVCTTSGSRCEYAPVWDVGPWNTRDDYWNPSAVRENWKNLPQGRPEAQAAYQYGYNGGRDQFGRRVLNPGGIDLADGTFWDGLLLTDNAWVDVAYLWTGGGPRGVVGDGPLNIRTGPGTGYGVRGLAAERANVPIQCYVTGQRITGPYRTTTRWNRLASGQYVSHAYISAVYGGTAPPC